MSKGLELNTFGFLIFFFRVRLRWQLKLFISITIWKEHSDNSKNKSFGMMNSALCRFSTLDELYYVAVSYIRLRYDRYERYDLIAVICCLFGTPWINCYHIGLIIVILGRFGFIAVILSRYRLTVVNMARYGLTVIILNPWLNCCHFGYLLLNRYHFDWLDCCNFGYLYVNSWLAMGSLMTTFCLPMA